MHVCNCVCSCVCIYVCFRVCVHVCLHTRHNVFLFRWGGHQARRVCVRVCLHACVLCVCVCVCVCACVPVLALFSRSHVHSLSQIFFRGLIPSYLLQFSITLFLRISFTGFFHRFLSQFPFLVLFPNSFSQVSFTGLFYTSLLQISSSSLFHSSVRRVFFNYIFEWHWQEGRSLLQDPFFWVLFTGLDLYESGLFGRTLFI